jgi:hypothetical protein
VADILTILDRYSGAAGQQLLMRKAGYRYGNLPNGIISKIISSFRGLQKKELGIDISGHRSKHIDEFEGQSFDYVLTVCDNARESCPLFPGVYFCLLARSNEGCRTALKS